MCIPRETLAVFVQGSLPLRMNARPSSREAIDATKKIPLNGEQKMLRRGATNLLVQPLCGNALLSKAMLLMPLSAMTAATTTASSLAACSAALPVAGLRFHGYGYGKSQRGGPRLSFEERLARRQGKTREQKQELEARNLAGEQYIDTELPDICTSEVEKVRGKAQEAVKRVFSPVSALHDVQVDVGGQMRPLSQLATIVKATPREYDIVASSSAFTSSIMQRLPRYDASLAPHKVDNTKVRVTIQPMTRARRENVAHHLRELGTRAHKQWQLIRRSAINHIEELHLNEDTEQLRKEESEAIVQKAQAELDKEIEDLAQEVLNTSTSEVEEEAEDDASGVPK